MAKEPNAPPVDERLTGTLDAAGRFWRDGTAPIEPTPEPRTTFGAPGQPAGPAFRIAPTIARALEAPQKIAGIFGPVATGKTAAVCMYVFAHCLRYAPRHPGQTIRWVFVRDTFESIKITTLKSWLQFFPDPAYGRWHVTDKTFTVRLPKGQRAEVIFMGLDDAKDVGRLLSMDLSGAVIDEPAGGIAEGGVVRPGIPKFIYEGVLGRLRHPIGLTRRRLFVLGNPPPVTHWCYTLFRPREPQPHGETFVVNVPKEEAPILTVEPGYYDTLVAEYGGPDTPNARRYVFGEWPVGSAEAWTRDQLPVIPRDDMPKLVGLGATVDPATGASTGGADRSAIAVAGFDAAGTAYLLDLVAGRLAPVDLVASLFALQAAHDLSVIGFESVAFSSWLKTLVEQEQRIRKLEHLPALPMRLVPLARDSRVAKLTRIQGALGARIAQGRLKIVQGCRGLDVLYAELEDPERQHDDCLDALADLDQIAPLLLGHYRAGDGSAPVGVGWDAWRTEI